MFRLLFLVFSLSAAFAVQASPESKPFEERYPPASVTTEARADEVIEAYQAEVNSWNDWKKSEDLLCYKKFMVNDCLAANKKRYNEQVAKARRVWLVARDFKRSVRTVRSTSERNEKLQKQEERNSKRAPKEQKEQHSYVPLRKEPKKEGPVSSGTKEASREAARTPEPAAGNREPVIEQELTKKDASPRTSLPKTNEKQLTAEEIKRNEEAYQEKQRRRDERVAEENKRMLKGSDPEQREEKLSERRRQAEQKRLANIRKRTTQAAEYQRKVEIREQQSNQVLEDLTPIIFK
jgi:hypothetical protein